jgi:polysaccharide biosynthesis transport protein
MERENPNHSSHSASLQGDELIQNNHRPLHLQPSVDSSSQDSDEFDIQQILLLLKRRIALLSSVTAISAVLLSAWTVNRPSEYTGSFRLLIEPVTTGSRLENSLTSGSSASSPQASNDSLDYISQIEVLKSPSLLRPMIEKIQSRYPQLTYKAVLSRLTISHLEKSKMLDFSYESEDAAEVQFVLSQLSNGYIQYSNEDRQSHLKRGTQYVYQQIQQQLEQVKSLEAVLEDFRRRNNITDPNNEAQVVSSQVSGIRNEQRTNQIRLAAASSLYQNLQRQLGLEPAEAVVASTLSEAPVYQDLLSKLRELESQIAIESARFQDQSPVVQALQSRRSQLLPLLQAEARRTLGKSEAIRGANPQTLGFQGSVGRGLAQQLVEAANQVQVLQTQNRALAQVDARLNQEVGNIAGLTRQYGQIQRDLGIASGSLERLLETRETLQLELTRQEPPWEQISGLNLVQRSNLSRNLLVAGFSSLVLGIAAALLAEKIDQVFHTVEGLKETKIPCLGVIPFNKKLQQSFFSNAICLGKPASLVDQSRCEDSFMEAFCSLDTNLRLLGSKKPMKLLTISSASSGDGKSIASAFLALAAAVMGRKVLLIDLNFRQPRLHSLFNLPNERGLADVIENDVDVNSAIQVSSKESNLHILTTGQLPPMPGRLLSSDKIQGLMEQFSQAFDLVICDAPPLLNFSDAKLLAAHTDGILLVARFGKTKRSAFRRALDDLNASAQTPLGVVAMM